MSKVLEGLKDDVSRLIKRVSTLEDAIGAGTQPSPGEVLLEMVAFKSEIRTRFDRVDIALQRLQGTVAGHTATLAEHSAVLAGHTATLAEHSAVLAGHTATLAEHSAILAEHTALLKEHSVLLKEILSRLPTKRKRR